MAEIAKPMVNLQVKVLPGLFEEFERQYAESECKTKGQFFELIFENFLNPKTSIIPDPQDKSIIEDLKQKIDLLTDENNNLRQLVEMAREKQTPQGAIVLNFDEKTRRDLWEVFQVSKKQGFAETWENMIINIFQVVRARGEMILTDEDKAFIKTLSYE